MKNIIVNKKRISLLDNKSSFGNLLKGNSKFSFALKHALLHYSSGAIYTFIPKNACSSLRLSLALANGLLGDESNFDWIHNNNDAFQASLKELVCTPYSYVILRCPFERILSVYLDKIVGRTSLAWSLENKLDKTIEVSSMTFLEFVRAVKRVPTMDHHWRAQSDFLIYEEYDDYFDLKNFSQASIRLNERIGFEITDSRGLYKHGSDQVKERYNDTEDACNISPIELLYQKYHGRLPENKKFFSDEIVSIIQKLYKDDISLYTKHFGADNLMF